jgi:hypothetical protein
MLNEIIFSSVNGQNAFSSGLYEIVSRAGKTEVVLGRKEVWLLGLLTEERVLVSLGNRKCVLRTSATWRISLYFKTECHVTPILRRPKLTV